MICAASGAARSEAGNADLLNAWKRCLLSTTFAFQVLATPEKRAWYALQQCEGVSAVHLVAHRSCFQRRHEVARVRQRLAETTGAKVTS